MKLTDIDEIRKESMGIVDEYIVMYKGEKHILTKEKSGFYFLKDILQMEEVCVIDSFAKELIRKSLIKL